MPAHLGGAARAAVGTFGRLAGHNYVYTGVSADFIVELVTSGETTGGVDENGCCRGIIDLRQANLGRPALIQIGQTGFAIRRRKTHLADAFHALQNYGFPARF